ncbi:MAG: hypothetical protein PWP76_493 [Candidatus Diapherotrites archaeon]|nr:hypothetical protein [Candidatus Diapherotrites archaeon]MDN5367023.1 hypothetical protein [Candidatus Diapherotrites archaeon]
MRIVWTVHALERLAQRRIRKESVISAIKNPDAESEDAQGNRRVAKRTDGQVLVVIIRDCGPNCVKVITAYVTSRVEKYLG